MMALDNLASVNDYGEALGKHGESPRALHWTSYKSQAIRFRALVKDLDIEGKTILDAGCGMGDLIPFLYAKSTNFTYLGVDRQPEFIEIASRRYEGENFKVFDPFKKTAGSFDIVISSGVMNANMPDWLGIRKQMIASLFGQTAEVLTFNMAGGLEPPAPRGKIAYAKAQDILEFCRTLSDRVGLDTRYHPEDFTILMYKKSS